MKQKIGKLKSSIANLELTERVLTQNTLILAEEGSGKTHLSSKIREYVMDNGVPTLYLDFSDPEIDEIEPRFKESGRFYHMRFEESDAFDTALQEAISRRENIYMAVNPNYFSNKRDIKSRLSKMLQTRELLDNYYYFFHEISLLNAFYTKFEDFMLYIFDLVNLQKFGLTFLTQPHETFEDHNIKLLFSFLYLGKCCKSDYYNTDLKTLPTHTFVYQYRMDGHTLLFNDIESDFVVIDH
ncbi:MAG: ATP-binding protein [Thiovulaceae bacterium]|nr:ATP-binding protein [Sulfurimonadaceae bacterium]